MSYEFGVRDEKTEQITRYLSHEQEPADIGDFRPSFEDEAELLANRFFLKRRVWRNMNKIRRASLSKAEQRYVEPKKRIYRAGHHHLMA